MSEHETEPAEEPVEAPAEPDEEEEAEEDEQAGEDGSGFETTLEPPEPAGLTEKQIEARFAKLGKENEKHAAAVGRILEEDAQDLLRCPLCADFIAGFILNAPVADEPRAAVLGLLGVRTPGQLNKATYLKECPECVGTGEIETHSKRPGYEVANCEACQGTGYQRITGAPSNGHVMAPDYLAPLEQPAPPPPADLAEVERLKAMGYTVVAPYHPGQPS